MPINFGRGYFLIAATLTLISCSHTVSEDHEATDNHHHDNEIILSAEDAERFGVKTENISPKPFNSIIRVTGQIVSNATDEIMISAPTSGIITLNSTISPGTKINGGASVGSISAKNLSGGDQNEAAKVAVTAAKRELERLEPLMKEGIVTKKEYNAALSIYQSAKAAYSAKASSGIVTAPSSGSVLEVYVKSGDFVDTGAPIAKISKNLSLLLQADLPEKYRTAIPDIISANIRLPYSDTWINIDSIGGKRLPVSENTSIARSGYIPVMFSLTNNGTLSSGGYVDICLMVTDPSDAISVPSDAIIEQQGNFFVFVRKNDHGYEKRKVETGQSNGTDTQILSGLTGGENVVTEGATIIRLAENSGNIPQGHSHDH